MNDDLPDSGEPGLSPPAPGSLPHPEMWPDGDVGRPFRGVAEDSPSKVPSGRRKLAYLAVAIVIVGALFVAFAIVTTSWTWCIVGVVVGAVGVVLALRSRIMEGVSVTDSPRGPG